MPPKRPKLPTSSSNTRVLRSQHVDVAAPRAPRKAKKVTPVRQRDESVSQSESNESSENAEEVAVPCHKRTRARLLEILGKKVKKKLRLSTFRKPLTLPPLPEDFIINRPSNQQVDYSEYTSTELIDMLHTVGVDTRGFDQGNLLQSCHSYTDLTKTTLDITIQQETSTHIPENTRTNTTEAGPSVSFLPSLEHRRFLYPRPLPTNLPSTASLLKTACNKGKSKAKSTTSSQSDWAPSEGIANDFDCDSDSKIPPAPNFGEQTTSSTHRPADNTRKDSSTTPNNRPLDLDTLHILLIQSNQKVESLKTNSKALTQVVHNLAGVYAKQGTPQPKRCGGRTADLMRFHIDTLIGLPEGSKLPSAANPTQTSTTTSPEEPSTSGTEENLDPCFPHKYRPGHKDATPQQIQIMHQMLADYKVVSVGGKNETFIKKCLDTYVQLLSKRDGGKDSGSEIFLSLVCDLSLWA
ncbi:uncharacterized protein MELLADRAFT_88380 [Melampsora larici-populina 98AG31]|uniref:Uncharacterized protein n=1 Tax=Melampsora larici-populina (strain 98AG31 / pathotype 3-4-7) TaxID=747676 RepID=F4RRI3_MELLP|nr:uncharacterized protein MELLADRAFT_88380 [Melampsora larici-populina 98AG31]EGG04939.1 hypothetical protein MELLADRAFT_88380 [Melampsora larici-populina 98AG31]